MSCKILVVDDEHDIADLLEVYLRNENHIPVEEHTVLIDNYRANPVYLIHKFDTELQICR